VTHILPIPKKEILNLVRNAEERKFSRNFSLSLERAINHSAVVFPCDWHRFRNGIKHDHFGLQEKKKKKKKLSP